MLCYRVWPYKYFGLYLRTGVKICIWMGQIIITKVCQIRNLIRLNLEISSWNVKAMIESNPGKSIQSILVDGVNLILHLFFFSYKMRVSVSFYHKPLRALRDTIGRCWTNSSSAWKLEFFGLLFLAGLNDEHGRIGWPCTKKCYNNGKNSHVLSTPWYFKWSLVMTT